MSSGYVGNSCAATVFHFLGIEVDCIHTVRYSNHGGYGCVRGSRLSVEEFQSVISALRKNCILQEYTHLLTGYLGPDPELISSIHDFILQMKQERPDLVYFCDPVCGDEVQYEENGEICARKEKLYLPKSCLPELCRLLHLADVIRCNLFEIRSLLRNASLTDCDTPQGEEISCVKTLLRRCFNAFMSPTQEEKLIMVSHNEESSDIREIVSHAKHFPCPLDDKLACVVSFAHGVRKLPNAALDIKMRRMLSPRVKRPYHFAGTGDLLTALLLAYRINKGHKPPVDPLTKYTHLLRRAVAATFGVCCKTAERYLAFKDSNSDGTRSTVPSDGTNESKKRELALISCANLLRRYNETELDTPARENVMTSETWQSELHESILVQDFPDTSRDSDPEF